MERLTEGGTFCSVTDCDYESKCRMKINCYEKLLYEKLREYEDLEEQGLLLKLPCKVGDEVWRISTQHDNYDDSPYKIVTRTTFRLDMLDCTGKTVFLTKAEAEKALAEMEK